MNELEMICFNIISTVGTAKSMYFEAIQEARANNFEKCEELLKEGRSIFVEGHKAHAKLIQKEASGEPFEKTLLLIHAEDQMMQAEMLSSLAEEFIYLHKKINGENL